jgi:hypothetical protein
MDLMQYPRPEFSIQHFARPNSWELDGRDFALVMDDGYDVALAFRDRKLRFTREGSEPSPELAYFCFKGDDTTFFVSFDVSELENHVYVLDLTQRLVTRLICRKGLNPKFPQVAQRFFCFGAIRMRGYKLPYKRHSFTTEHLGTTVQWRWSPTMVTKHAYLESDWYRITWNDKGAAADEFDATNEMIPATDDHAQYVKIKENMILLSVTEENGERLLGDRQMFRCDNLTLLQNYDRMYQVGRGYGDLCKDGAWRHIHVAFCSYGSPPELPEGFLERENPFTV